MIQKPFRFFIILLIVSALLFTLDQTRVFSAASSVAQDHLVAPVVTTGTHTIEEGSGFFASLLSFRNVISTLDEVEQERDFYRGEYLRLRAVDEENEFLRQALQVESGRQKLVLAEVTTYDTFQPNQEVTINKGSRDGIEAGQAVIVSGRTLAGIVRNVEETTSTVLLITSEEARIPVLLSASQTNAVVTGSATGVLRLDLVPREVPLTQEELVVTSGIAGTIPPNLPVGTVRRIIDDEAASFKRATVEPLAAVGTLRQVFVVTKL